MSDNMIQLNEELIKHNRKGLVHSSVEEPLNADRTGRRDVFQTLLKILSLPTSQNRAVLGKFGKG